MSRRSILLACLLGLIGAALAAAWWLFGARERTPAAPLVEPAAAESSHAESAQAAEPAAPPSQPAASEPVAASSTGALRLHGVVRDDLGRALSSFAIVARPTRAPGVASDVRTRVERSFEVEDGRYALDLAPGRWMVHAQSGCVSPDERVELALADTALDFVVPRTARAAGRVEDPFGRAVPGARVCFVRRDAEPSATTRAADAVTVIGADESGSFAFAEVVPGTFALEAAAPGWAASESIELALAPGQELEGARIVLRHPARIRVLALDATGAPDGARDVTVLGATSCASPAPAARKADAEGRTEFVELAPGTYFVTARPREAELAARETRDGALALARLATPTQVELREGDDVEVVLGGVPAPTIRLWGVVSGFENADGALTVNAHRVEAAHFARQQFSRVDERGGYEIQLDAAGAHDVTVESRSGKLLAQRVDVAGPQQRLDLQLGVASIRGRALDSGGAPVARADVRLSSADETLARRSETDADGAFAFTALAPGTYELVARAPRGRTAGSRGLVGAAKRSGVALASGERVEDLELHFAAGAAIEVEVTAASGPLANARVRVADAAGRAPDVAPARWTDARGRTRIEGLPAGAWFVQALDERLACAWSGPIEVAAGATASARLELESGAVLEVEIAGLSEPGTWLVARDSRGLELAKTWTRAGSRQPASLGPLPLGRITLAADDERGHSRALELSIDAPRPPTVRLDLSR